MIPTSIDGTDITGATIDGTDVTEITVDGDTVFTAVPDIPDSGGTHQYNHDEASGSTLTDSIGSLDGSINGATWETNAGAGGAYLDYDGNNDSTVLTGGASGLKHFTNAGTGTLFAWVNPDSLSGTNPIFGAVFSSILVGLVFTFDNNDLFVAITYGNSPATIISASYGSSTGVWNPVAMTANGSTLRIFEGDPITEIGSTSISNSTSSNWDAEPRFGNEPTTTNDFYDGGIDLAWIDDVARSQSDLQQFVDDSKNFY